MSRMHNPPHPGEIIEEYIPKGMTQEDVANCLGITRPHLNKIIQGHSEVTTELAVRLALGFDTTPEFWLNLQMNRNLWEFDEQKKSFKVKRINNASAA
jgi:antitoxin HigA-1